MSGCEEERLAWAYLVRVAEPPAPAVVDLVGHVGAVEAARMIRSGDVPDAVLEATSSRRLVDKAAEDLAAARRVGGRLVVPGDAEWPAWALLPLANAAGRGLRWACPPLGLWVRGKALLSELLERAVSVVGARAATGYGEHVATDLAYELARNGMTVVSGAAYGIDGCAHRGALNAEGRTLAVLACGIDQSYPAGHTQLLDRITGRGLVVSEYPPGTQPARHRFLVRNRLIAALSAGTVVVEAGVRSGARNTASSAAALGSVLMAVPGPVTSAMSAGCHELLRDGLATTVCTAAHVIEAVGQFGDDLAPKPTTESRPTDSLEGDALRVHEALEPRIEQSAERIAELSGVALTRVRAVLPALELLGLADRPETGWRRTKANHNPTKAPPTPQTQQTNNQQPAPT
nr:DNA-processing protein DprA [Actinocrispum wychmicini]